MTLHLKSDAFQLSKHFKYYEMVASNTAERLELPNVPTFQEIEAAILLAETILEPIRTHFKQPFSPTSWFRGEELERALCWKGFLRFCGRRGWNGKKEKWEQYLALKSHPQGEAVDLRIPTVPGDVLFAFIQNHLAFDQCIREYALQGRAFSGWGHVSFKATGNRQQVLTIGG